MRLNPAGAEYANWTVTSDVALTNPPALRIGGTDHASTWAGASTGTGPYVRTCRLLVCGPNAGTVPGATALPLGRTPVLLVVNDTPEVVIRPAGTITVQEGA